MRNDFLKGWLMAMATFSLYQDIVYGSAEKYANYILNNWIDRRISIPIALFAILIVVIPLVKPYFKKKYARIERKKRFKEGREIISFFLLVRSYCNINDCLDHKYDISKDALRGYYLTLGYKVEGDNIKP